MHLGNIKEQKIPSQTAGSTEDAVLPKLVDRNGSLGLQLIILGVFCAVIGVVLFGLPSFQNYSDVHAVGMFIFIFLRICFELIYIYITSEDFIFINKLFLH